MQTIGCSIQSIFLSRGGHVGKRAQMSLELKCMGTSSKDKRKLFCPPGPNLAAMWRKPNGRTYAGTSYPMVWLAIMMNLASNCKAYHHMIFDHVTRYFFSGAITAHHLTIFQPWRYLTLANFFSKNLCPWTLFLDCHSSITQMNNTEWEKKPTSVNTRTLRNDSRWSERPTTYVNCFSNQWDINVQKLNKLM